MARRIPLEKATGAVALAYLVLIPIGFYYLWQRVSVIDQDVVDLMKDAGKEPTEVKPFTNAVGNLHRLVPGVRNTH